MNTTKGSTHFDYDIFISHNRADKPWAYTLAGQIAGFQYNGRPLRPWLDEQFLNPGDLSSESELTTAIDRSRLFGLILSPESVASEWVDFELKYFLQNRKADAIILMLLKTCVLPEILKNKPVIDFTKQDDFEKRLNDLRAKLCPPVGITLEEAFHNIDFAFSLVEQSDPGGFSAEPTPERDQFFEKLTIYNIDNASTEGLALNAYGRAAEHILRTSSQGIAAAYNLKMLLGECLGAAIAQNTRYRQVAQLYLDMAEKSQSSSLQFVVIRCYSKLAEIDLRYIDLSVLLRIVAQLDIKNQISNEERAIETLLGRTIGKVRDTAAGEIVIKNLSEGGRTSRIVAAWAISYTEKRSEPVFYLSNLRDLYEARMQSALLQTDPPDRKLLALYFGLDLDQDAAVGHAVQLAKQDLKAIYPGIDFPYGYTWSGISSGIEIVNLHNAPFTGTIFKATMKNMEEMADILDVSNVVCLTEPRIVDALFNHCGALLILEQGPNSPQCHRLRNRGIPFGMMSVESMSKISDGDQIIAEENHVIARSGIE